MTSEVVVKSKYASFIAVSILQADYIFFGGLSIAGGFGFAKTVL